MNRSNNILYIIFYNRDLEILSLVYIFIVFYKKFFKKINLYKVL